MLALAKLKNPSGTRLGYDSQGAMQKLIVEICDASHEPLCEPVFLESPRDLPMGVKQAVEDFIDANDGEFATPLVVTARAEHQRVTPCVSFLNEAKTPTSKQPMNIANIRESSEDFHLLETTGRTQTATMTLKPGEATAEKPEAHPHSDQTVVVLDGELVAEVGGEREVIRSGQSLIIPAGVKHRFRNDARNAAFAFTVYAPPAYQTDDPT